ncbi:hypothetical protein Pcinc_016216 [Petrolisthes cinctipes]|uniref:3-beta hydroxysteroid dehydrogenase/isomerase domain-containing protein n=1 Tax=Petrolisthes cinctipes TaxID=88211 RepID=A0AAE1FRF8_PETCI|nr:hypothetical protein Pcinc_016216 [Petrolisthes cinctipes]
MEEVVVAVLGGSGFLGQYVVHQLLEDSLKEHNENGKRSWRVKQIRVLDVTPYQPCIAPPSGAKAQVEYRECDVRDGKKMTQELTGVVAVINCTAIAPNLAKEDLGCSNDYIRQVNFEGVREMVEACKAAGVRVLIHTSNIAVIMRGVKLMEHTETHTPLPTNQDLVFGQYARIRLAAEKLVLEAHDTTTSKGEKLQTVALRPPIMYGEGDIAFIPEMLRLARATKNVIPSIGNPEAFMQAAYVGNVAEAHVCALRKLLSGNDNHLEACGGMPVYVTDNTPPHNLPGLVQPFLESFGIQPSQMLPYWWVSLMMLLAGLWTAMWSLLGFTDNKEASSHPIRALHRYAGTVTVVSRMRAELCLRYSPPYSWPQALKRATQYYTNKFV